MAGLENATFAKVGKLESTLQLQFRHLLDTVARCDAAQKETAAKLRAHRDEAGGPSGMTYTVLTRDASPREDERGSVPGAVEGPVK